MSAAPAPSARDRSPHPPGWISHSRPTWVEASAPAIHAVLASGHHAGGVVRSAFEDDLARRVGVPHAVATSSGFAALHLALMALGVEREARVVIPSYVCGSVLASVLAVGARPVVADVHPRFWNVTAREVREALARERLTPQDIACAIVPHILGFPAPLHLWDLPFPVIEDAAMALGARLVGEDVGRWGRLGIFSFYATKMISTGHGGMVVTADAQLAEKLRDLMRYDERPEWRPSFNYEMSDVAAALGRAQLAQLGVFLDRREILAETYRDACRRLSVDLQEAYPESTPNHFRFTIQLADSAGRDRLRRDLLAAGIESKPPVFRPLHRYLRLDPHDFPATESIFDRALSVPIYPALTDDERDRVVGAIQASLLAF